MSEIIKHYEEITRRISAFDKESFSKTSAETFKVPPSRSLWEVMCFFIKSVLDFFDLLAVLLFIGFNSKKYTLIYTQHNLCSYKDFRYKERYLNDIDLNNRIYINQGKEHYISRIDNYKVYNIGGVVQLISVFYKKHKYLKAYQFINTIILSLYTKKNVLSLCHYDQNGLSLIYSKYRNKINLIEFQHGGIINYPPYELISSVKVADQFYVRNQTTIDYLKNHVNRNFTDIDYFLIPYKKDNLAESTGTHILYASTVEIGGLHPVLVDFLDNGSYENLHLTLRLHPREKDKKQHFINQLEALTCKIDYTFDESLNWLENNKVKNLIVISPWSSVIEEAADNGFQTLIIDPIGKKRYDYLIDSGNAHYASTYLDIETLLKNYAH